MPPKKPKKPSGQERPARPSQTCRICGQPIYAANQADLRSAVANHEARHNANRRGGAR